MKLLAAALCGFLLFTPSFGASAQKMVVYKTRTCGCCGKWVEHMKANGFDVEVNDVPSTADYRRKYGVPEELRSCHTAVVNGYAIEGHVPAADVQRLLKSNAKVKGISAPGMPIGSPGMEQGPRQDAYDVVQFTAAGTKSVFQSHPAK